MNVPAVSREQVLEAVKQLPSEALPEVAKYIEFVRFKIMGLPLEQPPSR